MIPFPVSKMFAPKLPEDFGPLSPKTTFRH